MNKIRHLSLFSGYGGAEFALKKANIDYECIGFSEIDIHAIKLYGQNFPEIKNYGDVKKIKVEELSDFNLITAGFPCQDVSMAGLRDISKGRTSLFNEIIRIAEYKKPQYMLLENVEGLLSNKEFFHYCLYELRRIGYHVLYKLMNSQDYGIPQNRERIFFVCKLGKWDLWEFLFPEKQSLIKQLKDILEPMVADKYYYSQAEINRMNKQNRFGNHVFDSIDFISPTLCHIGDSDVARFKINDKYRKLTPKECFRLMGFLNDEINISGIRDKYLYALAGNGWDIHLASLIFKHMFKVNNNGM